MRQIKSQSKLTKVFGAWDVAPQAARLKVFRSCDLIGSSKLGDIQASSSIKSLDQLADNFANCKTRFFRYFDMHWIYTKIN